ncbi:NlpC P60 family protein [Secundilactobacillus kimchicus JCM 15530]|uniref:NlpC P60 family protein n=1 Tax=Secundilactobacillus kimchicus JCM 15530 TaxID=1302272 RepID=A0A0R1HPH6_9LACO|nr:C40 family peptidase [Secundilactobacillus kimchicus]KRK48765.1 NlpC P60 family protein [Secundilactobacillus kimchicus JCM 15530]
MKLKQMALVAIAGLGFLGGAVVNANAATIQALPNQTAADQAYKAVTGRNYVYPATTATTTVSAATTSQDVTENATQAQKVVAMAKDLAGDGIPYVWGGESMSGMDCSGLTDWVYQHAAGISLGHYTVTQESHVAKKSVADAKPGDLLFWGDQGASYHVAIYIGDNQFVAAPQPGQNVDIETISTFFMPSFAGTVTH